MPTENRSSNTDPRDVFIRLNPLGLGEEELRKDSTGFEDPRTHGDYLLFLAGYRETHPDPQPHPEPIAWMVGTAFWWTKEEAERDAAATGLPIVGLGPMTGIAPAQQYQGEPVGEVVAFGKGLHEIAWAAGRIPKLGAKLYTHADPGEVERLLEKEAAAIRASVHIAKERDSLRAQLDEAHALLQQAKYVVERARAIDKQAFGKGTQNVEPGLFRGLGVLLEQYDAALSASAEPEVKS
ncbi:hypothetical protein [Pseudomonas sp. GTC 16482]|uniref:hypothetical protein n=1 Tax=Pseudomonas sp. GTC 16482 TaxID=1661693 RepID=UPI0007620A76|nr:hypothetical protein [Pseudomonas sp. GTC 16482]